jgi:hypothetical protein
MPDWWSFRKILSILISTAPFGRAKRHSKRIDTLRVLHKAVGALALEPRLTVFAMTWSWHVRERGHVGWLHHHGCYTIVPVSSLGWISLADRVSGLEGHSVMQPWRVVVVVVRDLRSRNGCVPCAGCVEHLCRLGRAGRLSHVARVE